MPAATRTRNDLVKQALSVLQRLEAGQAPPPEDFDEVDDHVDAVIASLSLRDIVTIDDVEAIPVEFFIPLATILAEAAADAFGLPGIPGSPTNARPGRDAEDEIREIVYARPTFEPMKQVYF